MDEKLIKVKTLYKIPLNERYTSVSKELGEFGPAKLMEVDGIGLYVHYDDESQLTHKNIRSALIGIRLKHAVIAAENLSTALTILKEFDGMSVGIKHKALELNSKEPIIEFHNCPRMFMDQKENIYCAYDENDDCPAGCIVDNYDPPESCPFTFENSKRFTHSVTTFSEKEKNEQD